MCVCVCVAGRGLAQARIPASVSLSSPAAWAHAGGEEGADIVLTGVPLPEAGEREWERV